MSEPHRNCRYCRANKCDGEGSEPTYDTCTALPGGHYVNSGENCIQCAMLAPPKCPNGGTIAEDPFDVYIYQQNEGVGSYMFTCSDGIIYTSQTGEGIDYDCGIETEYNSTDTIHGGTIDWSSLIDDPYPSKVRCDSDLVSNYSLSCTPQNCTSSYPNFNGSMFLTGCSCAFVAPPFCPSGSLDAGYVYQLDGTYMFLCSRSLFYMAQMPDGYDHTNLPDGGFLYQCESSGGEIEYNSELAHPQISGGVVDWGSLLNDPYPSNLKCYEGIEDDYYIHQ